MRLVSIMLVRVVIAQIFILVPSTVRALEEASPLHIAQHLELTRAVIGLP